MSDIARVTIGGVADTALGIVLLPDFDEPMLPKPRQRFVEIPGRAGRQEFDGDLSSRLLDLHFAVVDNTTAATLAANLRTIAEVLLDDDGVPNDVTVVFTKESSKTYTGRFSGEIEVVRMNAAAWGEFWLPIRCQDPYAYDTRELTSATITTDPQTIAISNGGDYTTPPVFTLYNAGGANVDGFTLVNQQEK